MLHKQPDQNTLWIELFRISELQSVTRNKNLPTPPTHWIQIPRKTIILQVYYLIRLTHKFS